MQGVAPLEKSDKVVLPQKNKGQKTHQAQLHNKTDLADTPSDHVALQIAAGDDWSYTRPGMPRQTLRRLRRGHWRIQAQLDLHGSTRDEARNELTEFLDSCTDNGFRCVCVIHGKGLGSKNHEAVLKASIGDWLAQRNDVVAFCQARPENGGSGAVVVLLKA